MIKAFLEQGGAKTDALMAEYIAGMDGMVALASIYVPLDGMNEKNLTANIYFDCRWDEPMSFSIE